jgi:hypothetical protein
MNTTLVYRLFWRRYPFVRRLYDAAEHHKLESSVGRLIGRRWSHEVQKQGLKDWKSPCCCAERWDLEVNTLDQWEYQGKVCQTTCDDALQESCHTTRLCPGGCIRARVIEVVRHLSDSGTAADSEESFASPGRRRRLTWTCCT